MKQARYTSYKKIQSINRPLDPPRKRPEDILIRLSDRVTTAHGPGTVVQIAEDRYLIELDGQIARVWERASSLKIVAPKQV
ncbi:MAG: hypothetical protein AB9873_03295 [Syntrophobacteraceae bacterium]